jgi:hypothetical protein
MQRKHLVIFNVLLTVLELCKTFFTDFTPKFHFTVVLTSSMSLLLADSMQDDRTVSMDNLIWFPNLTKIYFQNIEALPNKNVYII